MLSKDFKEFIQLLNLHQVKYLVVGGYAVAFHGYPRYTKDIDIWILNTEDNGGKLLKVMKDFGFSSLGLTIDDFLLDDNVIQLGYPPNRIDIITGLNGVDFTTAYNNMVKIELDKIEVNFIDLESLKQSKRIAGRPKDLEDINNLE